MHVRVGSGKQLKNLKVPLNVLNDLTGTDELEEVFVDSADDSYSDDDLFLNTCLVINRVNMLLFKNLKAIPLIYHRNRGDNFLFCLLPLVKFKQNGFALG